MSKFLRGIASVLAALAFAAVAQAGTVRGTVNNATTGKPGAGVAVVLIQLQGGMTPIANTTTDAKGQFTFDNPDIGARPMLVRAIYKGVNFHQPLPPGKDSVTVDIFEPTSNPKTISVPSRLVIFLPNGANLTVGEVYGVRNVTSPPAAYFRADGNFEVQLPENAELKQVAASGPSSMPVAQAPIDKGKNRYAIAFVFRPGQNEVRFSYQLPYFGDAGTVKIPATYGGRLLLAAPANVKLTSDGLRAIAQEKGMNIYERGPVAAGTFVTVALSGKRSPPARPAAAAPGRAENAGASDAIQAIPGRLDTLKWPLIGGFCILFLFAAILLLRKPVPVVAPEGLQRAAPKRINAATVPRSQQAAAAISQTEVSSKR